MTFIHRFRSVLRTTGATGLLVAVTACATPEGPIEDQSDPLVDLNRSVHEFNKSLDRAIVKPASEAYVVVVPEPARNGISNVVDNIGQPLNIVNHTLQGDVEDAGTAFTRFVMNTVFGFGGLLDIATDAGVPNPDTDFGETLAVWGVGSGPYVELPLFGPSTVRDAFGLGVDFAIDPVNQVAGSEYTAYRVGARVADVLQTRNDLARVIEVLYYESADSYTATRLAFLQNRASELNDGALNDDDLEDPYAFE